jgi:hypothetical protein
MFGQFSVFTVLPKVRKQISLICFLSILKLTNLNMDSVLFWSSYSTGITTVSDKKAEVEWLQSLFRKQEIHILILSPEAS